MRIITTICLLFLVTTVQSADFEKLYDRHANSVVTVHTTSVYYENDRPRFGNGLGSGVLIEKDQILTAAHVVEGVSAISVSFNDGIRLKADVISLIEKSDIALLRLRETHPSATAAVLGDSDKTGIGSEIFIIGAPFGISKTLSVGHLSGRLQRGVTASGTPVELLQTDASINKGNSGGPMFNTRGEVIGIISFIVTKSGGYDGVGFAIASNTAQQVLLSSSGVLVGFEAILLNEEIASVLNFPDQGLLVQRVSPESVVARAGLIGGKIPAQIAGKRFLLGGDLILELNGVVSSSVNDFEFIRTNSQGFQEEKSYEIKIFRDGDIRNLTVATTPAPKTGLETRVELPGLN